MYLQISQRWILFYKNFKRVNWLSLNLGTSILRIDVSQIWLKDSNMHWFLIVESLDKRNGFSTVDSTYSTVTFYVNLTVFWDVMYHIALIQFWREILLKVCMILLRDTFRSIFCYTLCVFKKFYVMPVLRIKNYNLCNLWMHKNSTQRNGRCHVERVQSWSLFCT